MMVKLWNIGKFLPQQSTLKKYNKVVHLGHDLNFGNTAEV